MNPKRVMIVEDSATVRELLAQAIGADPRLTVVAQCASGEHALECLHRIRPDVISMDIHLPGISGLDATRRIMEARPTPIVIVSRSINAQELDATMEALRAGAVSALEKPRGGADDPTAAARICRELVIMSEIKVIRQRFNQPRPRPAGSAARGPAARSPVRVPAACRPRMLGIVASTGGPHALEVMLTAIGANFPLPIVLVQHMTPSFQSGFVTWLDRTMPQPVKEARDGDIVRPGHVYVAPTDQHLLVRGDRLALEHSGPVGGQRPSGTVLLESMADSLGAHAMGVVLTGMGDDGALGLLAIRRAGGATIAEDQSTAVVNGMPEEARRLGAAAASLPLDAIGPAVLALASLEAEVCA